MATACGFWWRAASVVWEAKLQKQKSCNLLLNWDFISILTLMIDCICQFVPVHCCFKNVDYNFLLFGRWKLQYSEYALDIEYCNVVFLKVDIEHTPIVNLTLVVWTVNAEYVHVMTRQFYRYDAPRMYVCDYKMEAPTWVEAWQALYMLQVCKLLFSCLLAKWQSI